MLEQLKRKKGKPNVQRFKGLGEMNPMQLRETTLDPNTRRLVQLVISDEDEQQTTAIMDMLLAKKRSEDRRNWLQEKGDSGGSGSVSLYAAPDVKGSLRLLFHGITESAGLKRQPAESRMLVSSTSPLTASRPELSCAGFAGVLQDARRFPLLDHDDRVGRCGLEADAGGTIHQRGIAVAAGLLQRRSE